MRAPGDRRLKVRFEVFGAFWGTLDVGDAARLHDLTPHGALIEAKHPLAVESVQSVCLVFDGQTTVAHARVRYIRPSQRGNRYLVGVEFLSASTTFLDAVEHLMAIRPYPTEIA